MRLTKIGIILLVITITSLAGSLILSSAQSGEKSLSISDSALAAEEPPSPVFMPLLLLRSPQKSSFGVEMRYIGDNFGLEEVKQSNAAWVRKNGLLWSDVEPVEGTYNWTNISLLENELKRANSEGLKVILVIRKAPPWAQADPGSFCGPIRTDKLNSFANFMKAAVKRYSVPPFNVKYFEIWNEPDADRGLGDSIADPPYGCWGDKNDRYYGGEYYTDVLSHVYPAVKAANPSAQVVVGGLLMGCKQGVSTVQCDHQEKYLEGILYHHGARDGGDFFDILNFHSYDYYYNKEGLYGNLAWGSDITDGPAFQKKLPVLQNTMDMYGFGHKEIIITETALLCGATGDEPYCQTNTYEKTKANYLAQAFALSLAKGIRTNIWYAVTSVWRGSDLLDSNLNKLPAYYAFDFAEDILNKSWFKRELGEYPKYKGLEFERADKKIWILWSTSLDDPDGDGYGDILPVTITLPSNPSKVYTVLGNELTNFSGTSLRLTAEPVYLVWDK